MIPGMVRADNLPLSVLLSRVLGSLTAEVEEAVKLKGEMPSLAVWSNVLRCVADGKRDGIDERSLSEAARISKRLAVAAVTGSARRGWIRVEPIPGAGKHRRVHLSDVGQVAARVWPKHLATLDEVWKGSALLTALEELVRQLPFELPHFPAAYGTADPSAIGGPSMQGAKRRDDLPAHGNDWKPVMRGETDTVSGLSVTALLSQTLMAFTIDYEDKFPWPLANTATVLRHIGTEPCPLADLPVDHEITGQGKSLLERHLIVAVTADPTDSRKKLVALTDRGELVLTHHPRRLEAVEKEWRVCFGDALIAGLRDELGRAAPDGDYPDHVIAPLYLG
jgi:hypothetical protein